VALHVFSQNYVLAHAPYINYFLYLTTPFQLHVFYSVEYLKTGSDVTLRYCPNIYPMYHREDILISGPRFEA